MTAFLIVLAVAAGAYLLGSVDTGILVSKYLYHDDVRTHGSGAAGMTNMLRTFGKKAAALTAVGDVLKGVVAVCLGRWLFGHLPADAAVSPYLGVYLAAILAVVGHSKPIYFGFKGGHGTRSQHYAGVSFDVGQSLTQTARTAIYNAARGTGAWGYVEPLSQTPTWVHMDRRYGTPACSGTTAGYPTLRRGSRGCYVMILQDALSTLGYQTGSRIDGIFGARTEEALKGFQRRTSLRVDGVCGCNSWKKISTAVIGVGRTKTTID